MESYFPKPSSNFPSANFSSAPGIPLAAAPAARHPPLSDAIEKARRQARNTRSITPTGDHWCANKAMMGVLDEGSTYGSAPVHVVRYLGRWKGLLTSNP